MQQTTLASFKFPRHLVETPKKSFVAQELIDFLKLDPSYFLKSFRKKFKSTPSIVVAGDVVTGDPSSADAYDIVSKKRTSEDLLAATAALADFHQFILRENVDRWEAIAPDLTLWRDFPGAYVLWTAKIVRSPLQAGGADHPGRLRVVRQLVANESARDAVSSSLHLFPEVRTVGEDMIVAYLARKTKRPAHADEH